ncbi:hypothetical protein KC19_2G268300 [Ceratodon purpureus]|uniref:Gamma-glutamylcyclotransferase AIG2-like domain-containing protein n=1 Tax=Ceratodon purpureus TaxID=3225 RepID=A0A8T0J0Y8_CERPU|nr:hypothetical protein KC19_2G268300 [Ceratodon purpureus]
MAEEADHVFVYGKLRPDAPDNTEPLGNTSGAKKAYLMGSRLYCFNKGGQQTAAVRLEEAGHSVTGYVVKAADSGSMSSLLQESESKEYSPQLYERDIVEVITEKGERVSSYVYHIPDVEVSNPVPKGDWLQRSR